MKRIFFNKVISCNYEKQFQKIFKKNIIKYNTNNFFQNNQELSFTNESEKTPFKINLNQPKEFMNENHEEDLTNAFSQALKENNQEKIEEVFTEIKSKKTNLIQNYTSLFKYYINNNVNPNREKIEKAFTEITENNLEIDSHLADILIKFFERDYLNKEKIDWIIEKVSDIIEENIYLKKTVFLYYVKSRNSDKVDQWFEKDEISS
jgi:uncharacterized membrane protein YheB (UPF0754 family)